LNNLEKNILIRYSNYNKFKLSDLNESYNKISEREILDTLTNMINMNLISRILHGWYEVTDEGRRTILEIAEESTNMDTCGDRNESRNAIVLICDVINSKLKIEQAEFKSRVKELNELKQYGVLTNYTPYAEDEFQIVLSPRSNFCNIIREIRGVFRDCAELRIGVGFGTINEKEISTNSYEMTGTAFHNARKAIEEISTTKESSVNFRTGDTVFNRAANTIYKLMDGYTNKWTRKQWEAVIWYQSYLSYERAAEQLEITTQGFGKRIVAANWNLISESEKELMNIYFDWISVNGGALWFT